MSALDHMSDTFLTGQEKVPHVFMPTAWCEEGVVGVLMADCEGAFPLLLGIIDCTCVFLIFSSRSLALCRRQLVRMSGYFQQCAFMLVK
jgi:hypothetical protein